MFKRNSTTTLDIGYLDNQYCACDITNDKPSNYRYLGTDVSDVIAAIERHSGKVQLCVVTQAALKEAGYTVKA